MIYLDNAATSFPKPESVYQVVNNCLRNIAGSPGRGSYEMSRLASSLLYEMREEIATLFDMPNSDQVIFTANATEAINIVLQGILEQGDIVITTAMEHNAVARTLRFLEKSRQVKVIILPCFKDGSLDCSAIKDCPEKVKAVVVNHISNVTGTIAPLEELTALAKTKSAFFVLDASQSAGLENIHLSKMGIDFLACSGHKGLLGPQGTGVLCINSYLDPKSLKYGGTGSLSESDVQPDFLPDSLESGTPNTPGIAGLLAGVRFVREVGINNIRRHESDLTTLLLEGLFKITGVTVYGKHAPDLKIPVVSFNVAGCDGGEVAHFLDREYKIACRSGLHCAPWAHQSIGTLKSGTVRLSVGYFNSAEDVEQCLEAIKDYQKYKK